MFMHAHCSHEQTSKRVREVPNVIKTVLACPCNLHPHPAHFRIHEYYFQKKQKTIKVSVKFERDKPH